MTNGNFRIWRIVSEIIVFAALLVFLMLAL